MNRLKKLRNRDAAIVARLKSISDKLSADDRVEMNDEEKGEYDSLMAESKSVQKAIEFEEKLQAEETRLAAIPDRAAPLGDSEKPEIPIRFLRGNGPKNFKGPTAREDAYRSGQWLRANIFGDVLAAKWCQQHGLSAEALAQNSASNSAGGVLVPDEFSQAIIDLRETFGVFRQQCRVVPMGSDTLTVPRRVSGLTAYFVGEADEVTESEKSWDNIQLVTKQLAAMVRWSDVLDEDAIISLADDLASEIAYAFSEKEDRCGFLGDGTSTYGGIIGLVTKLTDGNHAGGVVTAASGHTSVETLDLADYSKIIGELPEYARMNAKWFVSRAVFANSMQRLEYAAGGNTVSQIEGGTGMQFMGYPVVISQVLNSTLGADVSKPKALFGNLQQAATLGNRRGITISSSRERYFEFRQIAIQGNQRFDINIHDVGDATNAGPVLVLETAAS